MRFTSVFTVLAVVVNAATSSNDPSLCSCGFKDPASNETYTESLIIYFNETETVDSSIFTTETYDHRKEKGWKITYRQGAVLENVAFGNEGALPWQDQIDGNSSTLELWTDPSTSDHLVNGAQLRSVREDILYGSFRAEMRSAQPWIGGSALTFALMYNDSTSLSMDMCNQDNPQDARITNLINGEWPEYDVSTNYTVLQAGNATLPPLDPWDFIDLGFDWTNTTVDFYIGKNRTRAVNSKDRTLPTVPQPLYLWHWSSGDPDFMMGPPMNRSVANVRWVRAFFNSSLMSDQDHQTYDQRCNATAQCSTEDNTLRISTPYSPAATKPYEEPTMNQHIRWIAGVVAAVFSSFGVATLINAVVRRGPWKKIKSLMAPTKSVKSSKKLKKALRNSLSAPPKSGENLAESPRETSVSTGSATPLPTYSSRVNTPGHATPAPSYRSNGSVSGPASGAPSAAVTPRPSFMDLRTQPQSHVDPINSHSKSPAGSIYPVNEEDVLSPTSNNELGLAQSSSQNAKACEANCADEADKISSSASSNVLDNRDQGTDGTVVAPLHDPGVPQAVENIVEFNMGQTTKNGLPAKEKKQLPAPPNQQRIDYLSGFLVFSCLGVTLRHFSLTFWPYVTESYGPVEHFKADHWLAYLLGPYLLTPLWIGPFFVTSCRFLAARYLKNGKLSDIANKILLRGPRMLIPCFIFIILEYFLLELGLTGDLEWLPSISWSTWPYVTPQPNFGVFLNELVELSYLIPNGAPEVINHYCVGVLWTIPVQHFFSYVTLLAAVMIRDVKKPWKRFLFYTLTIICGWYASSWSACHWAGLMLADLDITYNWIKWTQARWWAIYPVIILSALVAAATPLILLFNSEIFFFSFMSYENAIHPDPATGRPILSFIGNVDLAYPAYYAPSLAVLVFSVSFQMVVEFSTWVQWFFSRKFFVILHPHIMTIYLSHGFVFWSLGSWLAVTLASINCPYWAILLIVGVVCYTTIFLFALCATPLIEFTTQATMRNIWRWATEAPVPARQTTAPFFKALILDRSSLQDDVKVEA